MIVGIVGVEKKKLTPARFVAAVVKIHEIVNSASPTNSVTTISSGACHLGGIDAIAEAYADFVGLKKLIFPPIEKNWSGYKERNLQIAKASDVVYCITVKTLPDGYDGMRFDLCYHCGTKDHIKSGGCWTVKQAQKMGKQGFVIVLD